MTNSSRLFQLMAPRVAELPPSATLKVAIEAARRKKAGDADIRIFAAGQPHINVGRDVVGKGVEQFLRAYDGGEEPLKYGPKFGIEVLREHIASSFSEKTGIPCAVPNVLATVGVKGALDLLWAAFGDNRKLLNPFPSWPTYEVDGIVRGANVVFCETAPESGFVLHPEVLRKKLEEQVDHSKPYILLLCSPDNPTGGVYSEEEFSALAKVLQDYPNVVVIQDIIYEDIVFGKNKMAYFGTAAPEFADRVVYVGGPAKSYGVMGLRIGFIVASEDVVNKIGDLQNQMLTHPGIVDQYVALACYQDGLQFPHELCGILAENVSLASKLIEQNQFMELPVRPQGSFYMFPQFKREVFELSLPDGNPIGDCFRLTQWLLDEAKVALVPGAPFGPKGAFTERCARISVATSAEEINDGLPRIEQALSELS